MRRQAAARVQTFAAQCLAPSAWTLCPSQQLISLRCLGPVGDRQPLLVPSVQWRSFAAEADPLDGEEVRVPGNAKVHKLVEEILQLNLLEVADLTEVLQKRLGLDASAFAAMPFPGAAAPGPAPAAAAAVAQAPPEPEKTEFDVKLQSFDQATKIKLIKEIRVIIPELGLKEAKDMVEKAPVIMKAGLKKDEAEALQKKLEAVGGKVVLE